MNRNKLRWAVFCACFLITTQLMPAGEMIASVALQENGRANQQVYGAITVSVDSADVGAMKNVYVRMQSMGGLLENGVLQMGAVAANSVGVVQGDFTLDEAAFDSGEPLELEIEYTDQNGATQRVSVLAVREGGE